MTRTVEEFIEHYGTKGMKWGVRRQQKKVERADKKWEKKALGREGAIQLYNSAAGKANRDLPKINEKWKNVDLTKDPVKWEQYHNEVIKNFNMHLGNAANEYGTNPSGTKRLTFDRDTGELKIVARDKINHADDDPEVRVVVDRDDFGHIRKILLLENDVVEHAGVKGMKWGVRKSSSAKKTEGSKEHREAQALRKKGRKNLTNKQLKSVNERLTLDQNFDRMNPNTIKRGTVAATTILTTVGLGVTAYNTVTGPAGKATINLGKKVVNRLKG